MAESKERKKEYDCDYIKFRHFIEHVVDYTNREISTLEYIFTPNIFKL